MKQTKLSKRDQKFLDGMSDEIALMCVDPARNRRDRPVIQKFAFSTDQSHRIHFGKPDKKV